MKRKKAGAKRQPARSKLRLKAKAPKIIRVIGALAQCSSCASLLHPTDDCFIIGCFCYCEKCSQRLAGAKNA